MKKWIVAVFKRIGDLIIKLISAKVIAASVITWFVTGHPTGQVFDALIVALSWFMVVGFRYAEKSLGLLKMYKE